MNFRTSSFFFISTTLLFFSQSGCSKKAPQQKALCGEKTVMQGTALGIGIGAIASSVVQSNIFIGAIVGGLMGTLSGRELATLQCKYYGEEKTLLENISSSIQAQNNLANKTNRLNQKMSSLYREIEELKERNNGQKRERDNLLNKIAQKREEILNIQTLNSQVMQSTREYYNSVSSAKFSQKDKNAIQTSLTKIFRSLNSIENTSRYNLSQLEKFQRRIK